MTIRQPAGEITKEQLSAEALQQVVESSFFAHNIHLFVEYALLRATEMRYSIIRDEYVPKEEDDQ